LGIKKIIKLLHSIFAGLFLSYFIYLIYDSTGIWLIYYFHLFAISCAYFIGTVSLSMDKKNAWSVCFILPSTIMLALIGNMLYGPEVNEYQNEQIVLSSVLGVLSLSLLYPRFVKAYKLPIWRLVITILISILLAGYLIYLNEKYFMDTSIELNKSFGAGIFYSKGFLK